MIFGRSGVNAPFLLFSKDRQYCHKTHKQIINMGKLNYNQKKTNTPETDKPARKREYIAVDVWRTHFGRMSVEAIKFIFQKKFGISDEKMKFKDFSEMVNALRRAENPDYIAPTDQSISKVAVE